jgi:ATP-dependent DNA helicase RecQ
VLAAVEATGGTEPREVGERTGFGTRKAGRLLNLLEQVEQTGGRLDAGAETIDAAVERAEAHRSLQQSRVDMMRGYAETVRCRAEYLLGYFGEEPDDLCRTCDNCRDGVATGPSSNGDTAYPLQSQVRHEEFGTGTVTDLEEDRVTVLFDDVGYRTLALEVVEEQGLLERA